MSLSFDTISSSGPNGAVIHYKPSPETARPVDAGAVYLCDSGGQYLDGTTDVTRTLHFGAPTAHERECYTRVLQGHIGLAAAKFPSGASGVALDALARAPMWAAGLDYRHGTGHGVGAFLGGRVAPPPPSPHTNMRRANLFGCTNTNRAQTSSEPRAHVPPVFPSPSADDTFTPCAPPRCPLPVHEGPQGLANTQRGAYTGGLVEGMTITDGEWVVEAAMVRGVGGRLVEGMCR